MAEPTNLDRARQTLLKLAAIGRGWLAVSEENARTAFHDVDRDLSAHDAAAQKTSARVIEAVAAHLEDDPDSMPPWLAAVIGGDRG